MKSRKTISREIIFSVAGVTVATLLLFAVGSYVIYAILLTFFPDWVSESSLVPTPLDLVITAAFCLAGLAVAVVVAIRLARRLLHPLNILASSLSQITAGDLSARAPLDGTAVGETAILLENFNSMASRLEKSSEEIKVWNAVIAHELRTPVTILRGRLQGLAEGVFTPEEALFKTLLQQTENLSRLIDDLRTLTLIENNRLVCKSDWFDLKEEIEQLLCFLEPRLREHGFGLSLNLHVVKCFADQGRLRQALLALVDNAWKHASPGVIEISSFADPGGIRVVVSDQGEGISNELLEVIFRPFRSGYPFRGGTTDSSGLGLFVVKSIAEAHGGSLTYEKSSDRSSFVFTIPSPERSSSAINS
jgi:two-component system sensor histidine kinase AdeS